MLEELTISNFALIEKLHLLFRQGFTVLSGETGAGKSILAGALGLLAGNKASNDSIRTGAEEAEVSGSFSVKNNEMVLTWLADRGLELDGDQLIVRRVLRASGKGSVYVQGSPVTVKELSDLSPYLFDMHGQHEHQNLFDSAFHRKYLDGFGGLQAEVQELTTKFLLLSSLKKKRDSMIAGAAELKREKELLSFASAEISEAKILPGEDQELENEKSKLESVEELRILSEEAYGFLNDEDNGILRNLSRVRSRLGGGKKIDQELGALADRFDGLFFELEDASGTLGQYKDKVLFDPERLEEIQDRLDLLYKLKKKYGPTLEDLEVYRSEAEKKLKELGEEQEDSQVLSARIRDLEKEVVYLASELTKKRKVAAATMEKKVMEVLSGLRMGKNTFVVQVTPKFSENGVPLCGPMGADEVEYMLSANPGEPLKALKSVASGGEISRVMLSVKSVLSEVEEAETLVFDEIDAGIGGEVGAALGTYLHKAAEKRQLLSITHLASIAVQADNHIKIEKVEEGGRTYTRAQEIQGEQRVREIARMLSGHPGQESSLAHALELLKTYHQIF